MRFLTQGGWAQTTCAGLCPSTHAPENSLREPSSQQGAPLCCSVVPVPVGGGARPPSGGGPSQGQGIRALPRRPKGLTRGPWRLPRLHMNPSPASDLSPHRPGPKHIFRPLSSAPPWGHEQRVLLTTGMGSTKYHQRPVQVLCADLTQVSHKEELSQPHSGPTR